jgi:hypothetical protein
MILQGLSPEVLVRLLSLDRPGDDDSWLLFGPEEPVTVDESQVPPLKWAAE